MSTSPMHGAHAPGGAHRPVDLDDELAADGLELTPDRDEIPAPGLGPDAIEARSTLASFLRPGIFPATVDELAATAAEEDAPPAVVALLRQLPPRSYQTVNDVWVELGGTTEERPEPAMAEPTAEVGGTELVEADRAEADRAEADLVEADLAEADLAAAELVGADLAAAELLGAEPGWSGAEPVPESCADRAERLATTIGTVATRFVAAAIRVPFEVGSRARRLLGQR